MRNRKLLLILPLLGCMVLLFGCRNAQVTDETAVRAVVPVTVANPGTGTMAEYSEFPATSSFLQKAVIKTPFTGYVENCEVSTGDRVIKNQLLFELRTREGAALLLDSLQLPGFTGLIRVKASMEGVISVIDHPRGDFVQEGEALCSLVLPESLVFILEIPFDMKSYIRTGSECVLLLPGGEKLKAVIHSVLPSMSGASQTQRVILQPSRSMALPENLTAMVRIVKELRKGVVILPKSCVLSDEVMKHFWVMKLINDTMAVKVPVMTGISGTDSIEIVSPAFLPAERFVTSGNYGLGDTAIVRIIR